MSVRLTPHIISVADWRSPFDDPIIRQFLPLKSNLLPDHPKLTLDSLHEEGDSPVPGLVHRYPDKVLFLGKSSMSHISLLRRAQLIILRSHFGLSSILSLLHPIVRRGGSYRICQEILGQTYAEEMEQDVRVHSSDAPD
jgi:hypothetical protein